jgi:diamine N-acetyltransferase
LKGESIYLRALEPTDADIIYDWENNTEVWKISHTLVPFSRQIIKEYVNSAQDIYLAKQIRFMICLQSDNREVGTIDLFDYDPFHQRVGVGVLIATEGDRKNGYASEALQLVIDYCKSVLQIHVLYCNIMASNENSIRLFEKHGFEITGTKKDWIRTNEGWTDEHLLQMVF